MMDQNTVEAVATLIAGLARGDMISIAVGVITCFAAVGSYIAGHKKGAKKVYHLRERRAAERRRSSSDGGLNS